MKENRNEPDEELNLSMLGAFGLILLLALLVVMVSSAYLLYP